MRTAVINNAGMVWAQMPHTGKEQDGRPKLGETIALVPGLNLVDSKKLAILRGTESFEARFRNLIPPSNAPEQDQTVVNRPYLEIDTSVGEQGQVPDEAPLAKLPEVQCRALVNQTRDEGLLRDWMAVEVRPEVRKIVNDRLELLASGGPENAGARAKPGTQANAHRDQGKSK